jgi:hypothetical protein
MFRRMSFVLVIALVSCTSLNIPFGSSSSSDDASVQTRVASNVFATQTASIPTVAATAIRTPMVAASATPDLYSLIPAKRKFNHSYSIEQKYDKFKDLTMVTLNPKLDEIGVVPDSLLVDYIYSGNTFAMPSRIHFVMLTGSRDWQFLGLKQVKFLLDDDLRMSFDASQDGSVGSSGIVVETITLDIPTVNYLRIVNSRKTELQVGSREFALSDAKLEALRDLASRLNPTAPTATALPTLRSSTPTVVPSTVRPPAPTATPTKKR